MNEELYTNSEMNETALPSKEEVLMNEDELLNGLLTAADFKNDESLQRKIKVRRNSRDLFEFFVRPLTEEEIQECRKKVTKRRPDPRGRQFGMVDVEVDYIKLRSHKILMATVDKGSGVLWSNKKLKDKLGVIQDIDVIDAVLLGGEKDWITDVIDEISGFGTAEASVEEMAKN